jgi:hypothetical protein
MGYSHHVGGEIVGIGRSVRRTFGPFAFQRPSLIKDDGMKEIRTWAILAALGGCWLATSASCRADLILLASASGSGANGEKSGSNTHDSVSASVNFYYSSTATNTLVIDLFNTTSGGTKDSADVLVGLTFTLGGVAQSALTGGTFVSPTLTTQAGTSTELGGTGGNSDFASSFKTASPPGNSLGEFGVATNGFGNTFNGSGLNNQDNGIVANGTNLSNGGLGAHTPYAENGLEITLTFAAGTDLSKSTVMLSGADFLFGTSGAGVIAETSEQTFHTQALTPEPSTVVLALTAIPAGLGLAYRKIRRKRATA